MDLLTLLSDGFATSLSPFNLMIVIANLLTQRIQVNTRDIETLREELKKLKEDYAQMIRESYISKSSQNRLMFLFSSESVLQAYKRVQ